MSEWKVNLVFTDAKSNKFWRARSEGNTLYVNYGRVGTDGQTTVKDFGSLVEANDSLDKQAAGKRKKGYVDDGAAPAAAPPPPLVVAGPRRVALHLDGARQIDVVIESDGSASLRTEVIEHYSSPAEAAAALARIEQAMVVEGYQRKS